MGGKKDDSVLEKLYSLDEAAKKTRCDLHDILKYGLDGKIELCMKVPEDIKILIKIPIFNKRIRELLSQKSVKKLEYSLVSCSKNYSDSNQEKYIKDINVEFKDLSITNEQLDIFESIKLEEVFQLFWILCCQPLSLRYQNIKNSNL